jgi:CRP-like cAMP-binding protein
LCSWRRFRQGPQGDGLLLTLAWPGEYFGELALFNGAPRSAAATALDDCRLLFLPRDAFRAFLQAHPAALWTCLEVIVGQLRRLTAVADDLALLDLRACLARCLLRLADQGALASAGGPPGSRSTAMIGVSYGPSAFGPWPSADGSSTSPWELAPGRQAKDGRDTARA